MQLLRTFTLTALALAAVAAAQDVVPGLLAQLESGNPNERWSALERIVKLPAAMANPAVRSALLSRLDAENHLVRQTLRESGNKGVGEGFAEYHASLLGAVVKFADWDDANTLRILAQSSYIPESDFAKSLAVHVDRILPTLIEEASSDVPTIRAMTLAYITEILHVYKPQTLKPEEAAELLALLNTKATAQEPDADLRNATIILLRMLADVNRDGKVDCADMAVVQSAMGTKEGEVHFDARADINMDRVVDEKDLAYVGVRLPVGLRCPAAR